MRGRTWAPATPRPTAGRTRALPSSPAPRRLRRVALPAPETHRRRLFRDRGARRSARHRRRKCGDDPLLLVPPRRRVRGRHALRRQRERMRRPRRHVRCGGAVRHGVVRTLPRDSHLRLRDIVCVVGGLHLLLRLLHRHRLLERAHPGRRLRDAGGRRTASGSLRTRRSSSRSPTRRSPPGWQTSSFNARSRISARRASSSGSPCALRLAERTLSLRSPSLTPHLKGPAQSRTALPSRHEAAPWPRAVAGRFYLEVHPSRAHNCVRVYLRSAAETRGP